MDTIVHRGTPEGARSVMPSPTPPRRIFVVDDHPVVRRGLRELIAGEPDLEVAGEASDRAGALREVAALQPDLALVDLSLGSVVEGLELVKELHAAHPQLAILVTSMHDEEIYAERVLRSGARGFVGKHEGPDVFLERIRTVLRGGIAVSKDLSQSLVRRAVGQRDREERKPLRLSDRELEIFALIGEGVGTREIAERLRVSPKTVETHRERIKVKLGVSTASELVARAVRFLLESKAPAANPPDRS
jgi:DNA-binding NarL/FixJ family response regulator